MNTILLTDREVEKLFPHWRLSDLQHLSASFLIFCNRENGFCFCFSGSLCGAENCVFLYHIFIFVSIHILQMK